MYGGSHYIMSAAADLTPQGKSILDAAMKFGDGKTLPVRICYSVINLLPLFTHVVHSHNIHQSFTYNVQFPPCKRYYNPFSEDGTRLYACRLHSEMRMKRLKKEGWKWRDGEKHLDYFWGDDREEDKTVLKDGLKREKAR